MLPIRSAMLFMTLSSATSAFGQIYYAKDYYPLAPNTRWLYLEINTDIDQGPTASYARANRRVLPQQANVDGTMTAVVERSASGRTYAVDYLSTRSGLAVHRQVWYDEDADGKIDKRPIDYTPALNFTPAAMRVGDEWSFTSLLSGSSSDLGEFVGVSTLSGTLTGLATVSTQAGTFANALQIDVQLTRTLTGTEGTQTASNQITAWLAKGVGFVMDTEFLTVTEGGQSHMSKYDMELLATPQQITVLPGVPEYRWNYGCAPTSAAMILGYYDQQAKYASLVPGFEMPDEDWADRDGDNDSVGHDSAPAVRTDQYGQPLRQGTRGTGDYDPQTNPTGYSKLDKVIASEEHVRDYWYGDNVDGGPYSDAYVKETKVSDPWHQISSQPHVDNCLADYMACSKATQNDGWTASPNDVISALDKWASKNGFESASYKKTYGTYEEMFNFIKGHIDQGRPLVLRWPGHFVVCDGYLDGLGDYDWLAIHDTWMDGESKGNAFPLDGGRTYLVDGMYPGETEWWRFRVTDNTLGFVTHAIAWQPLLPGQKVTAFGEFFGDSFDRPAGGGGLGGGYTVEASSPNGEANLVASPFSVDNQVLRLSMPDPGGFVAIETDVATTGLTAIGFDYLFETEGKLTLMLDGQALSEITCPVFGPGSIGAEEFATYYQVFSLTDLGIDGGEMLRLSIQLSNVDDPVAYLDNLSVWGIQSVPEPGLAMLLLSGVTVLLALTALRRRARIRKL